MWFGLPPPLSHRSIGRHWRRASLPLSLCIVSGAVPENHRHPNSETTTCETLRLIMFVANRVGFDDGLLLELLDEWYRSQHRQRQWSWEKCAKPVTQSINNRRRRRRQRRRQRLLLKHRTSSRAICTFSNVWNLLCVCNMYVCGWCVRMRGRRRLSMRCDTLRSINRVVGNRLPQLSPR